MTDEKKSSSPPWDNKQPRPPQPLDRQALELQAQLSLLPEDPISGNLNSTSQFQNNSDEKSERLDHKSAQDTEMQEESDEGDESDDEAYYVTGEPLSSYEGNSVRQHLTEMKNFSRRNMLVMKGEPLSEDFTKYKMTSDIPDDDLQLHQILKDLNKRSTPETGFFVSEQLYIFVSNIIKALNLRKKDGDGNTSLLLLTEFLLDKNKPLVVTANNQINYAIYLFRLLVLRDLEHGLSNLSHAFNYFKALGKRGKKNIGYFEEIEDFYFKYDSYTKKTKKFFDLVKKPASEISEADYRAYARFPPCIASKREMAFPACLVSLPRKRRVSYFHSASVEDWRAKSPAMKKAELVFKLSDGLMLDANGLLDNFNKFLKINPFISYREFNQRNNFSIPSSILICSNKKQESPVSLLLQAGGWLSASNELVLKKCTRGEQNSNYMQNLALSLYETHKNKLSRFQRDDLPFWLNDLPVSLLKKSFEGLRRGELSVFHVLVLQLIHKHTIYQGNLKDLQWVFSLIKEHAVASFLSDILDPEDGLDGLDGLKSMIQNRYVDCIKYYIGQMVENNMPILAEEWSRFFVLAIQRKDLEIFSILLSYVKKDPIVFEKLKSDENHKYTFLDIAEESKENNSAIIKILTEEGFLKSPQEEKSASSDKKLSKMEYSDQSDQKGFEKRSKKRKKTNYDYFSDFFATIKRDSLTETDKAPEIEKEALHTDSLEKRQKTSRS